MFNLGALELCVIGLLVVLMFGTKRLPELGSGLGKAISNFRKSYRDGVAIDVTNSDPQNQASAEKKKEEDKAS